MKSCKPCYAASDGRSGAECPLRKQFPGLYSGYAAGCDLGRKDKPPVGPQTSQHALQRPEVVMHDAKPAKLEKDLQRLCEHELTRRGIWFLHLSPKAREKQGTPDLLFALAGRAVAVELKAVDGKVSEDQVRVMDAMERNGWECVVCRSFDAFKAFLDAK